MDRVTATVVTTASSGAAMIRLVLGTVATVALLAATLPLRRHGQHAHAGPGTLTVRQLAALPESPTLPDSPLHGRSSGERTVLAALLPKRSVHPEPSPLEHALAELRPPQRDPDHTGRHRLIEPFEIDIAEAPSCRRSNSRTRAASA